MRIGLLTYHWVSNYGANLQTFSTYSFLKKMGHDPIIINWIPLKTKNYYLSACPAAQFNCHISFINRNCSLTEEFHDMYLLPKIIQGYGIDSIVIGSDSLFNLERKKFSLFQLKSILPTEDHIYPNPFWGYKFENIPHVGLSISSQNSNYFLFKKNKQEIGSSLQSFKSITVRDLWTQKLVSYFTDGKITPSITPDPVFAFNENVSDLPSKEYILKKYNLPEKYILFCFNRGRRFRMSDKWLNKICKKFNEEGFSCVSLPRATGSQVLHLDIDLKMPIPPLDWYSIIRYSSGYIGVLMHPIVICIHNSVPFFSFDHYGVGPYLFTDLSSSKTHNIINDANLEKNYCNQMKSPFVPSPDTVFNAILNFPKNKCSVFAKKAQDKCLLNMSYLLNELLK